MMEKLWPAVYKTHLQVLLFKTPENWSCWKRADPTTQRTDRHTFVDSLRLLCFSPLSDEHAAGVALFSVIYFFFSSCGIDWAWKKLAHFLMKTNKKNFNVQQCRIYEQTTLRHDLQSSDLSDSEELQGPVSEVANVYTLVFINRYTFMYSIISIPHWYCRGRERVL